MKKIVRISLWLLVIAWCLFLYNFQLLGIAVSSLCLLYIYHYNKQINYWRLLSVYLITLLFSYLILSLSNIDNIYHLIIPFLLLVDLDISLVNENIYRLKLSNLKSFYIYTITSTLVFLGLSLIVPDSPFLPEYKTNLLIFDSLIFFPFFIEINICTLSKLLMCRKKSENLYN